MVVTRAVSAQGAQELELMLAERELDWALLPHTTRKGALRYLSAGETLCLDSAVLNSEARPHLVTAYKDLESAGFNKHVYTDEEDFRALRWVRKRGINLRGFTLEVKGDRRSGVVLHDLMGDPSNGIAGDLDMAKYYAERGRLQQVDATLEGTRTALLRASSYGHIDIVNALLAAGANKDQANDEGWTPLNFAAEIGHVECVKGLLAAGANKDQANEGGLDSLE